jgi:hypothetical protein
MYMLLMTFQTYNILSLKEFLVHQHQKQKAAKWLLGGFNWCGDYPGRSTVGSPLTPSPHYGPDVLNVYYYYVINV